MLCPKCGHDFDTRFCPSCGYSPEAEAGVATAHTPEPAPVCCTQPAPPPPAYQPPPIIINNNNSSNTSPSAPVTAPKKKWTAFLLCLFLGMFGVHRFYVGKFGTGVIYALTWGGFFLIGTFIDLIMILMGSFTDKQGNFLV